MTRPKSAANIYKNGRLKTRAELGLSEVERVVSGDLVCMGEGIGYVNRYYFDKAGKQIREFDVLKVFHFIVVRRKRHYMYKWVRRDDKGRMAIMHLTASDEPTVPLSVLTNKDGVFEDAEIVQSRYH